MHERLCMKNYLYGKWQLLNLSHFSYRVVQKNSRKYFSKGKSGGFRPPFFFSFKIGWTILTQIFKNLWAEHNETFTIWVEMFYNHLETIIAVEPHLQI